MYVGEEVLEVLQSVNFADLCITSDVEISTKDAPKSAFKLEDTHGVAVGFDKAKGKKCSRCWKILPDVGRYTHPEVCGRCNAALG